MRLIGSKISLKLIIAFSFLTAGCGSITWDSIPKGLESTAASLTIDSASLIEGNTATLTVTLDPVQKEDVVFSWSTVNGTAQAAGDYTAVTATSVTIPAGASTAGLTVTTVDDALHEADETLRVVLSTSDPLVSMSLPEGTITLQDNDPQPTIRWASASQSVSENVGSVTVTAELSTVSGVPATVPFTVSGTAQGADYSGLSSSIVIAAGSTTAHTSFSITNDTSYEADETLVLTLGTATNATVGSPSVHTITIQDNDLAPTVSIANSSVGEGSGAGSTSLTFTVSLSSISTSPVILNYATSDGTAQGSGVDYTDATGTLTIAAGSSSATLPVTITRDAVYEANETLTMTLSGGSGYTGAGSTLSAVGTITNDDALPDLTVSDVTIAEGTGGGTTQAIFTITLDSASGVATTVDYATSANTATGGGTDLTNASGTLTIAAGSSSATVPVTITRDALYEANETFYLNLTNPAQATVSDSQGLGTITDDDSAPVVNFSSATQSVSEAAGSVTVTATLASASGLSATVPFTVSGTAVGGGVDHNAADGQIVMAAGATTGQYTFNLIDNAKYEANKTVLFTMGTLTGATAGTTTVQTVTVTEDESQPAITISSPTATEGTGAGTTNATFTLTLNRTSYQNVMVDYATTAGTATGGGTDYTNTSGTLTIASGATTGTVSVPVTLDSLSELNESFTLDLTNPVNATLGGAQGTATISDDDTTQVLNVTSAQSNGAYKAGVTIPIQIVFSQSVTVTGNPRLQLETGSSDQLATYSSGSGSATLVFNYVIQSGDTSADLDYLSTSALTLNGGTIVDSIADAAVLTLAAPGAAGSLAANKALVIDTTNPTQPASADDGVTAPNLTSTPVISWGAATDVASGVGGYEIALGTSAGATDVVNWTDQGNVTSASLTGLTLTEGLTYYASVRAYDQAGNRGSQLNGDGFTVPMSAGDGTRSVWITETTPGTLKFRFNFTTKAVSAKLAYASGGTAPADCSTGTTVSTPVETTSGFTTSTLYSFRVCWYDSLSVELANEEFKFLTDGYCTPHAAATTYNALGSGTATDPFRICTTAQMRNFGANCTWALPNTCDKHVVLGADLDFTALSWNRITEVNQPFTGTFDGGFREISNVTLSGADDTAMFGNVSGRVQNLKVTNWSVTAGSYSALIVARHQGTLKNIRASGTISGTGSDLGGLTGVSYAAGKVLDSSATVTITSGLTNLGGVAGRIEGASRIERSIAQTTVSVSADNIGGLVGSVDDSASQILDSSADVDLTVGGATKSRWGGLVGRLVGEVLESSATGTFSIPTNTASLMGGLIGVVEIQGVVRRSYADLEIEGSGMTYRSIGGFTGSNMGLIENSYTRSTLNFASPATDIEQIGSFAGILDNGTITTSSATGALAVNSVISVGGFIGLKTNGTLTNNYWDPATVGNANAHSGVTGAIPGEVISDSTANLYKQATYSTWNFTSIWRIVENTSYPVLRWQR